jgi:hypothetical protein
MMPFRCECGNDVPYMGPDEYTTCEKCGLEHEFPKTPMTWMFANGSTLQFGGKPRARRKKKGKRAKR